MHLPIRRTITIAALALGAALTLPAAGAAAQPFPDPLSDLGVNGPADQTQNAQGCRDADGTMKPQGTTRVTTTASGMTVRQACTKGLLGQVDWIDQQVL